MLKQDKIIALYVITDDLLRATGHKEQPNRHVSDSGFLLKIMIFIVAFTFDKLT